MALLVPIAKGLYFRHLLWEDRDFTESQGFLGESLLRHKHPLSPRTAHLLCEQGHQCSLLGTGIPCAREETAIPVVTGGTSFGEFGEYRVKGVSQPTVERGSPGSLHQGKLLYQDGDRIRGRGQARWSYYSSSTLAPSRLSSDEILYIILPSSNPSPLHPAPPCAHPCWPLGPSPRNHLPFLLPCGSFCFFFFSFFPPLASGRA